MVKRPPPRLALVTGAAGGLGSEISGRLAGLGHALIVSGPEFPPLKRLAAALSAKGATAHAVRMDVADDGSVAKMRDFVDRTFEGRLDILINCAGIDLDEGRSVAEGRIARMRLPPHQGSFGDGRSVLDADPGIMRATFEVNTLGPLRLCQAFVPGMVARGYGRVVNVSSRRGQLAAMGDDGTPAYQVSKTALNAITRMVADAARGTKVLVNSVCPGWCRTSLGGPDAPRSAAEGADTIMWAATLPPSGPTGGFFHDRRSIPW
jgi:NAD(P)-dependent dehydrogenase (short-subunit alcohol dehydrogenase family)